jgi:ADP-ribosylglycohydrolase
MIAQRDRILGGLMGLLVGDCIGVPYEFHRPEDLPPLAAIDITPPAGFVRAHASAPPGAWSDDGAQALVLLESLLRCGRLDLDDFARGLLAWYEQGFLAVDGVVFDVGVQTGVALAELRAGVAPAQAGPSHVHANGNGSLMRVLPLALWHRGDDAALVADAQRQSLVTHGHPRAQVCGALYCLWARMTLDGRDEPWGAAVARLRELSPHGSPERAELEWSVRPDEPHEGHGSGYVVDTLRGAYQVQSAGSYPAVVRAAIALGHDTDTTACVAGGIAGIRDGVDAIPKLWLEHLRGQELLQPLRDGLLRWHGLS